MGYNTNYTLTVDPAAQRSVVHGAFIEVVGYDPFVGVCTWYAHEADIVTVASRFPHVVISVHGVGEDHDDEWIRHHLGERSTYERRPGWRPTPPPQAWRPILAKAEAAARDAAEQAERETYERLKKKYG